MKSVESWDDLRGRPEGQVQFHFLTRDEFKTRSPDGRRQITGLFCRGAGVFLLCLSIALAVWLSMVMLRGSGNADRGSLEMVRQAKGKMEAVTGDPSDPGEEDTALQKQRKEFAESERKMREKLRELERENRARKLELKREQQRKEVENAEKEYIYSPNRTTWGDWGEWEDCPAGALVNRMQLKVEAEQHKGDDTGLNGIRFFCHDDAGDGRRDESITSTVASWGEWGSISRCPPDVYAVGFELQSLPYIGAKDDVAATNLQLLCEDGTNLVGTGLNLGEWTNPQKCSHNRYICGIRTQVEKYQGHRQDDNAADDTALNNLGVRCCPKIKRDNELRLSASIFEMDFDRKTEDQVRRAPIEKVLMKGSGVIFNDGRGTLTQTITFTSTIRERFEVEELESLSTMNSVNVGTSLEICNEASVPFLAKAHVRVGLTLGYSREWGEGSHKRTAVSNETEKSYSVDYNVEAPGCTEYAFNMFVNVVKDVPLEYDMLMRVNGSMQTRRRGTDGKFLWEPVSSEIVRENLDVAMTFVREEPGGIVVARTRGRMIADVGLDTKFYAKGKPIPGCTL